MSACSYRSIARFGVLAAIALGSAALIAHAQKVGVFDGQQDIGTVLHAGSARYNSATHAYTVTGSGENMWFATDDFHFVWKKMSGDVSLTADIALLGSTGDPHRKALLLIRQAPESGSVSADIAVHASGLTSLQFRDAAGGDMHEVQANVSAPRTVRIEKRGDFIYAFVPGKDGKLRPAGAATRLALTGPFYVGIGVCAHNKDAIQTAVFSNVKLEQLPPATGKRILVSTLETVAVASTDRRVEYEAVAHFEAPNWTRDGKAFVFNQEGTLRQLALGSDQPTLLSTGPLNHCNNDHGISPDGRMMAISNQTDEDNVSRVYVLPAGGGTPKLITKNGPSYWHGWSPDGKTLAFTGERDGNFDIYTIPAEGGAETRLTTAAGLDDGADYSPDGAYIYFNSERTGHMQIWRMKADGSDQEQFVADDSNDWFPHISPDGQWMVFLAYGKGVTGHPANKDVEIRLMSMKDKKVQVQAKLFGGQGTINVPSWSPDSKRFAFVSYEELPEDSLSAK
jgi:TolB protein